jgi:hypothetical protein
LHCNSLRSPHVPNFPPVHDQVDDINLSHDQVVARDGRTLAMFGEMMDEGDERTRTVLHFYAQAAYNLPAFPIRTSS